MSENNEAKDSKFKAKLKDWGSAIYKVVTLAVISMFVGFFFTFGAVTYIKNHASVPEVNFNLTVKEE